MWISEERYKLIGLLLRPEKDEAEVEAEAEAKAEATVSNVSCNI